MATTGNAGNGGSNGGKLIGYVTELAGLAVAIDACGRCRGLWLGDGVCAGERIATRDDSGVVIGFIDGTRMVLGRNAEALLDDEVFNPVFSGITAQLITDVALLKQMIAAGAGAPGLPADGCRVDALQRVDSFRVPDELLAVTPGNDAGSAGGAVDMSGASVVETDALATFERFAGAGEGPVESEWMVLSVGMLDAADGGTPEPASAGGSRNAAVVEPMDANAENDDFIPGSPLIDEDLDALDAYLDASFDYVDIDADSETPMASGQSVGGFQPSPVVNPDKPEQAGTADGNQKEPSAGGRRPAKGSVVTD